MIAGLLLLAATAAAPAQSPTRPGPQEHAAAVFRQVCTSCHGPAGWATRTLARRMPADQALLTNRRDLTPDYLRAVVRGGIGSMPRFTPTDLSDAEITALAAWLASPNGARK
jgi:mono/diheme cytochrome c family protein